MMMGTILLTACEKEYLIFFFEICQPLSSFTLRVYIYILSDINKK